MMVNQRCPSSTRSGSGYSNQLGRWKARGQALITISMIWWMTSCGGNAPVISAGDARYITPGSLSIDTNCTNCNSINASGMAVEQFSTALGDGDAAGVIWSVAGGDAQSGAGLISGLGQYSPPTYLTADSVQVIVTATLKSHPSAIATARVTITPGFSRPLAPENTALGEHGTISFTGVIAEAGGTTGIEYALSKLPSGSSGGEGLLGRTNCVRSKNTFTYCTVTYSAPATVSFNSSTYVVANVSKSFSHQSAEVLLNNAGINSNPTVHQSQSAMPILLGTSSSNNEDYDTHGNQIFDCCGGTLGALIQSGNGRQYLLSCNHVLARADEARNGDHIIQPGLIDSNCTPNGDGPGTELIGFLSTWLPLSSRSTNVDVLLPR